MVTEIETVRGPVATADLGQTLMHEHVFVLSPESDINPNEPHMHSLTITMVDDDHMIQDWQSYKDGKPSGKKAHFEFTRDE